MNWTIARTIPLLLLVAGLLPTAPARAQVSMFADPKAHQAGDILTVVLVERTAAERESEWDNRSSAGLEGLGDVDAPSLSGRFALDATVNKQARNRNQSVQRDLLSGTITTRVVERDSTGNLVIAGERKLTVNGETHLLRVKGLVRPLDVRSNNTVLSYEIADANIEYERGGLHRRFLRPAALTRTALLGVLGAAVLFALQ